MGRGGREQAETEELCECDQRRAAHVQPWAERVHRAEYMPTYTFTSTSISSPSAQR